MSNTAGAKVRNKGGPSCSSSAAMPSSTHQAKRPYAGSYSQAQAQITSYFATQPLNYDQSSTASCLSTYSNTDNEPHGRGKQFELSSSLSPPLPALVQSNLLSVGMRVRKAVPEGYKTGSGYGTFTLFSDTNMISKMGVSGPGQVQKRNNTGYNEANTRKELTPFCGIMKVGGMAVQTSSSWANEDEVEDVPAEDDIPFLSSQQSTISSSSIASISNLTGSGTKRRFSEEETDEIWLDDRDRYQDVDLEISPKSKPAYLQGGLGSRPLAMPKGRRKRYQGSGSSKCDVGKGQENLNMMDFEEAEFLDYASGFRSGEEVVMDDV